MKLIALELLDGTTTYVNPDHIIRLIDKSEEGTLVVLDNGVLLTTADLITRVAIRINENE